MTPLITYCNFGLKLMKKFTSAIFLLLALSACAPLAFFANGSGSNYRGYKSDFGTFVASSNVNAFCLSPALRLAIWDFEGFFGKKVIMNSGYRSPSHNLKVGGAGNSYHVKCMAADIFIPGVSKRKMIAFAKRNKLIGGLGCYPNRNFIHIDVRKRPKGYKKPVTFGGC